jgi:hypothetical protein
MTLAEVKVMYGNVIHVPSNAPALVNGKDVPEDTILKAGDRAEFMQPERATER